MYVKAYSVFVFKKMCVNIVFIYIRVSHVKSRFLILVNIFNLNNQLNRTKYQKGNNISFNSVRYHKTGSFYVDEKDVWTQKRVLFIKGNMHMSKHVQYHSTSILIITRFKTVRLIFFS